MLYILMSDQDVLWWLLCQKNPQNISVLIREFEGTKTCNATNVPQEGRPLGKMLLLLFVKKLDVSVC